MIDSLVLMSRTLTPTEHLVLKKVCTGNTNLAISEKLHMSVKSVENSISRSARALGIGADKRINIRVLVALAYRANFQNVPFNSTKLAVGHLENLILLEPAL